MTLSLQNSNIDHLMAKELANVLEQDKVRSFVVFLIAKIFTLFCADPYYTEYGA